MRSDRRRPRLRSLGSQSSTRLTSGKGKHHSKRRKGLYRILFREGSRFDNFHILKSRDSFHFDQGP
jgi:hypothetical protein